MGALTSKPYAFSARPWELKSVESVDFLEPEGAHIPVDVRGNAVLRVLPRINYDLNQEWISDLTRFSYDYLRNQRLVQPALRLSTQAWAAALDWRSLFGRLAKAFLHFRSGGHFRFLVDSYRDLASMAYLGQLASGMGMASGLLLLNGYFRVADFQHRLFFSTALLNLEEADFCLLLGTNVRSEAPVLNIRLRRLVVGGRLKVFSLMGFGPLTNFKGRNGGLWSAFVRFIEGRGREVRALRKATKPVILLGSALRAAFGSSPETLIGILEKQLGAGVATYVLPDSVTAIHAGFLGVGTTLFGSNSRESLSLNPLVYATGVGIPRVSNPFVSIYQGSHWNGRTGQARYVLPIKTGYESVGIYLNSELRLQKTSVAVGSGQTEAKESAQVLKALLLSMEQRVLEIQEPAEGMLSSSSLSHALGATSQFFPVLVRNAPLGLPRPQLMVDDVSLQASRNLALARGIFNRRYSNFNSSFVA